MSAEDLGKYIPMIDAIISASNPDEVSPKKIRKALQELFSISLDDKRKVLNDLIVERFEDIQEYPRMFVRKDDMLKRDQEYATLLQNANNTSLKRTRNTEKKAKSVKKKKKSSQKESKRATSGMAARNVILSEKLADLVGASEMPRTQVVKVLWQYIKEHNLQNPEDRREIICDDKMAKVFGTSVTMFSMNKVLVKHIFNPDDVVGGNKDDKKSEVKKESDVMGEPE